MADLTDLATVKAYMGIKDATKDALINLLIPAISQQIEGYCGRVFAEAAYKGKVWSAGGNVLYLPNYPVTQVRRIMQSDKYVMKIQNTSADAVAATVQIARAEDGTYTMYLNVVGGANESNSSIDIAAVSPNTLTKLRTDILALAKGWAVDIVGGCEGYPATELLDFAGEPCLNNSVTTDAHDLYVPWDLMTGLTLEESKGRVKVSAGSFPSEKYIFAEYVGGYDVLPDDLKILATKLTAESVRQSERDLTLKSEKLGDYSWTAADVSVIVAAVVDRHATELLRWKRIAIG